MAIGALLTLLFSFPLYCRYRKGVMPSHFAKAGHQTRGGRWPVSAVADLPLWLYAHGPWGATPPPLHHTVTYAAGDPPLLDSRHPHVRRTGRTCGRHSTTRQHIVTATHCLERPPKVTEDLGGTRRHEPPRACGGRGEAVPMASDAAPAGRVQATSPGGTPLLPVRALYGHH
jgi:hypothetical protein